MAEPTSESRMSIADLLCHLREQLLQARAKQDHDALRELWKIVVGVLDAAYRCRDREVATLLEELGDSIRDSLMGVE